MISLASYWLTARRSLLPSSLIAFFGPIEMAACLFQFVYTLSDERDFKPIKIGSICVFVSGMILNLVFVVNFIKQVKGKDKEFERWRKRKWCAANFFLVLAGMISLTLYRLIYCRLFRLDMMSVKVSKPQPFLRPILIFSAIKMLVFNLPLIIVDIYGISILSWGNQVYMTMWESLILSLVSLLLQIWEWRQRKTLIVRESKNTLNLEKMENLDEKKSLFAGGKTASAFNVMPEETLPRGTKGMGNERGTISLGTIKFNL